MNAPLRKCVVAVVQDGQGNFLVGERSDAQGAWQLPQGGIERGETPSQAVVRELTEEVGNGAVEIVRVSAKEIAYLFPLGLKFRSSIAERFSGQSQIWFLLRFAGKEGPDLKKSDGEFDAISWKSKDEIIAGIIAFKKEAYIEGFAALEL